MRTIKTQIGTAMTADFEENTWTFIMPNKYEVCAGAFAIVDKPIYDEMMSALKDSLQMLEQTQTYRKENTLTGGNVFIDSTIEKVKSIIQKETA